jgi:hypothetical protein
VIDLTHLGVGDKVAYPAGRPSWAGFSEPFVTYKIYEIARLTATRLVLTDSLWVHRATGKSPNKQHQFVEATPEILQQHQEELRAKKTYYEALGRYRKASEGSSRNDLTTDQLNALSEVWESFTKVKEKK